MTAARCSEEYSTRDSLLKTLRGHDDIDREEILRRVGPVPGVDGNRHVFDCERITIEPFGLRDKPRYQLVIDRLAYWY